MSIDGEEPLGQPTVSQGLFGVALDNDTLSHDPLGDEPRSATCGSEFDKTIGVILFTAGVLYCFVGLAIICEGEFSASVVELAKFLKLSPDVAG